MTRHKPQPWYAQFNQPPRSPNGRNRKPSPSSHRDPTDGANPSPGGITWIPIPQWRALNTSAFPISAGVDPGADDTGVTQYDFKSVIYRFKKLTPSVIPYAGVRAGEITGHRMWIVLADLELCSFAHHFIWQPNATIEGKIDEVVDKCVWRLIYGGVYSFNGLEHIAKELQEWNLLFPNEFYFDPVCTRTYTIYGFAIGTVKCWGEVVEHEKGYRAQYAKLHTIDSVVGPVDLTELRKKYNV